MELHVIFGTGPLGKWTARALLNMGKQVRLINRSGTVDDPPTGVEIVKGDAYDVARNIELTRGATSVYQCAQPAYTQWPEHFPRLQQAILDAAIANGARLIAAENLYMYGNTHGQPMSENTRYNAHTRKGQVRQAMTEALFAAHAAGKLKAASVRGSDFFGPDDTVSGGLIYAPALSKKAVNVIGSLDQPHTFTYTVDFGKTLAQVGTTEAALGQTWHVPSNVPITQRALMDMLAQEIGHPLKTQVGTPLLMRMLGLFNPTMREMNEMMYEFVQPFIMDSHKAQRELGIVPTPLRQQLAETLSWAKVHYGVPKSAMK